MSRSGKRKNHPRIGTLEFRKWWGDELAITRQIVRGREEANMKRILEAELQLKIREMRRFLESAGITIEDACAVLTSLSEHEEDS